MWQASHVRRIRIIKKNDIPGLARQIIEEYILHDRVNEFSDEISQKLKKRAGVFVTVKKNGNLRGCIGTIKPT